MKGACSAQPGADERRRELLVHAAWHDLARLEWRLASLARASSALAERHLAHAERHLALVKAACPAQPGADERRRELMVHAAWHDLARPGGTWRRWHAPPLRNALVERHLALVKGACSCGSCCRRLPPPSVRASG